MVGIDTNVLVRYLVRDDKKQAERASAYIKHAADAGERFFINRIVLCELVWVLESAYQFSRGEIAGALEKMLGIKQFEIDSKDVVRQAIQDYHRNKGDLADHLIGRFNHSMGCDRTITFDRDLKNSPVFEILR
jgi:predicted nucleic-acid-binding protein